MSLDFKDQVQSFTNDFLLEQYLSRRDQYVPEAIAVMEEEIIRRGISSQEQQAFAETSSPQEEELSREDFIPFDHAFSQTDLLLATSILTENKIPYYVDRPTQDVMTFETETAKAFTIHVYKSGLETAHAALNEHFDKTGGLYRLKELGLKDRLRMIHFNEIRLPPAAEEDPVDVALSGEEKDTIERYAKKLLSEADAVEEQTGRPIFYFDNLERVIAKVSSGSRARLSVADLLTILEVIQVYCTDADFPEYMNTTIKGLLDFLESAAKE